MNIAQVLEWRKYMSINSSQRMLAHFASHTEIIIPHTVVYNDIQYSIRRVWINRRRAGEHISG
jgi:hypothetical protein